MSIDSIARQIATVDREINSVEKSIQIIDGNIRRKSKEAHNVLTKISREKDLKTNPHLSERPEQKKNEEISKLEKDKSNKSKTLVPSKKRNLIFKAS